MFVSLFLFLLIFTSRLNISSTLDSFMTEQTNFMKLFSKGVSQFLLIVATQLPEGQCKNQLMSLGTALAKGERWALRMVDATAKPQAGILLGNIMHIGNYDECLEIDQHVGSEHIQGKYCSVIFHPHSKYGKELESWIKDYMSHITRSQEKGQLQVDSKLSYGFCVPKVCTAEYLQNFTDMLENIAQLPIHFNFTERLCNTADGVPYTNLAITGIVFFSVFIAIMLLSTLYEFFFHPDSSIITEKNPNVLTAFSVITNCKKLFSTTSGSENLKCLDGLRVLSMMWIVLAHGFQHLLFRPNINSEHIFTKWKNATENSLVFSVSVGVDTFFVISGLLVVYLYMMNQEKGVKFSPHMYYLHRIIRLTPSLGMVVLFSVTFLNYMGHGPFWPIVTDMFIKPCEKNWWATLIYMQNYINQDEQCLVQNWYISVDTQMYFLAPLVFVPLVKWPRETISAIIANVVVSCSYVFGITWTKRLGTTYFDTDQTYINYLYIPTHVRGTVYLVGMVLGYYIYKTRTTEPLKLNRLTVWILWLFSLSLASIIIFSHSFMLQATDEANVLRNSIFNASIRIGWTLAMSVLILLCTNVRLNYNVYLLNLPVMILLVAQERTAGYFSNMIGLHSFWGNYMFTLAAATFWTLAFESPMLAIEKILFARTKATNPKKTDAEIKDDKSLDGVSVVAVEIPKKRTWSTDQDVLHLIRNSY